MKKILTFILYSVFIIFAMATKINTTPLCAGNIDKRWAYIRWNQIPNYAGRSPSCANPAQYMNSPLYINAWCIGSIDANAKPIVEVSIESISGCSFENVVLDIQNYWCHSGFADDILMPLDEPFKLTLTYYEVCSDCTNGYPFSRAIFKSETFFMSPKTQLPPINSPNRTVDLVTPVYAIKNKFCY
jgi:hypothetical protein